MEAEVWFGRCLLVCALAGLGPHRLEAEGRGPVVLELFTSQACSSCPPADELLSLVGFSPETRGQVVPLAFHVDYFNALGWRDPFSDAAWTQRQAGYAQALHVDGGPYTPQLVVNGQAEMNATNVKRLQSEVTAALDQEEKAGVEVVVRVQEGGKPAVVVDLQARVDKDVGSRTLELKLALFENGRTTAVGRGENSGRTLRNDFVVRRLETAFSMPATAGSRQQRQVTWKLDRGSDPKNLGVAAFLQDPGSLRIVAAAARPLVADPPSP
jgi:hypothetical protein